MLNIGSSILEEGHPTPFQRFFAMLSLDRKDILVVYGYALFSGIINLSLPLGIQAIISFLLSGQVSSSWGILVGIVVIGVAASGIIQILQLTVTEFIQRKIFARSAFEFAYRIPRLKLEMLRDIYPPELVNRFFDTLTLQKGLSKVLIDFSSSLLQIIFGLILLSFYHSFFVFFGFLLILLLVSIFYFTWGKGFKSSLLESKYKYEVAHWLEELARSMGTFKLAGETKLPMEKTEKNVGHYMTYRKKHFGVLILQYANIVGFKTLVTGGLLILGGILVINQEINLGQFVASEIIILLVLNSVEKLILNMETVYDVLTGLEKLGQVVDQPLEELEGENKISEDTEKGLEISMHEVNYSYPGNSFRTLKDIDLKIGKGEKVIITGPNASGKSTLINLLSGLYEGFEGTIFYDGIPRANLSLESLRSVIGDNLSHQDLFSGTLQENIHVGKAGISTDDVLWAIKMVGLMPFVEKSKDGLDTKIKPEGQGLPSSIKERIVLARTLAEKPRLIIIDQFLSNLDEADRIALMDLLTDSKRPWTLVAISNDPYFMKMADRVIYLKEGRIVEPGNTPSSQTKTVKDYA